ncbi:MAG: thioredoxin fold domain-containing protein [Alphaproteobacteria bacterium]|nr:thioredoxin fold domain-containing protein [Alphaproteobacteria bacterium]
MKKITVFILAVLISINSSFAQEKKGFSFADLEYNTFFETAPNPEDVRVLKSFIEQGLKFIYLGEKNSVDNWLSVKGNTVQLFSTTLDGKGLIIGSVYDENGDNSNLENIKKFFPKIGETMYIFSQKMVKDSISSEIESFKQKNQELLQQIQSKEEKKSSVIKSEIWASLENTYYIEQGDVNAPIVYFFSDLLCGHCKALYSKLDSYINAGRIRVRYIPVGILSEQSVISALGLFSTKNPSDAWKKYNETQDNSLLTVDTTDAAISKLKRNVETFDKWNLRGTPSLFYKNVSGEVKFVYGQPDNIEDFIYDLGK